MTDSTTPDQQVAHHTMQEQLKAKMDQTLKTLTYREREIIKLRYGLGDGLLYTHEEVGRIFKVTVEHGKKIAHKALRRLQHKVRRRPLEEFIDILAMEGPTDPEGYVHLLHDVLEHYPGYSTPNLFHYATKELSQDAFFCWLIEWAEEGYKTIDPALHQTAVLFLNSLLGQHGVEVPEAYESLGIKPQYKGIDIRVLVNHDIAVLIEDKTATSERIDSMKRYLETVRADYPDRTRVPVYVKTRNQACLQAVHDAGWKCFMRQDLLRVLAYGKHQGVKNPIFTDYHLRLMRIDCKPWRKRR